MNLSSRSFVITCVFCIYLFGALGQGINSFKINGVHPKNGVSVYLIYYEFDDGNKIIDSTIITNNKFTFSGTIEGPSYGGVLFGNSYDTASKNWRSSSNIWFNIFKGNNNLNFEGETPKNLGGNIGFESDKSYKQILTEKRTVFKSESYKSEQAILLKKLEELNTLDPILHAAYLEHEKKQTGELFILSNSSATSTQKIKEIQHVYTNLIKKYGRLENLEYQAKNEYVSQHPNDEYSLYLVKEYINSTSDYSTSFKLYELLSEQQKSTTIGKKLAHKIGTFKLLPGAIAPMFIQQNTNGKDVELAMFKGKYVLSDFWASWCVPCRQENPYLVAVYEKYRNNNFEIIGISLDDKKLNWISAIQGDNLQWVHVSDLKGWKNNVAILYGVRAIPTNYLIDPTGKIVAKNLRGEQLEKVLSEILNN